MLKYYTQFEGNLNKMLECVMLSSDADKERWVKDYIQPAIARGDVDDYSSNITKTMGSASAKKRKAKGSGGRKKKKAEMEESSDSSSSDSETPVAEIVDDEGMEAEAGEKVKGTKENKTSANKKKPAAAKKKTSAKAQKPTKKNASADDDLIAQIRGNAVARRREDGFDSLMAGLEEKYGGGNNKKKGKKRKQKDDGDIDDDEFAKIQAKLMKNKK